MSETLIGRMTEVDLLDRFVAEDRGQGLLLEGGAGIGKTRLWQEGVELARSRGMRVLATRPAGTETRLGFAGLSDLLAAAFDDVADQLPRPQRLALEVALLRKEPEGSGADERTVAAAFLASLQILARPEPLLVAVDDLQWLDPATAQVLAFALRRLEEERVSLLATVRTPSEEREPREVSAALGDRLTRVRVEPLTVGAVFQVLLTRLDLKLSRSTLYRVHEASAGNPFFALELGRALRDAGSEPRPGDPLPVPAELADVVRERLGRVSQPAAQILLFAASLSRPTATAVAAACGSVKRSTAGLTEAKRAEIVEFEGDLIRFAHPLLASTHYGSATPWERRACHARLAETAEDPEERARHLALSVEGPDERAAAALEAASERARQRGALAAAADLARRSVLVTPTERPDVAHRRRMVAARSMYAAGDTGRAIALLERALSETPPGEARGELLWTLGTIKFEGVDTRLGIDAFHEALSEVGEDSPLRPRILEGLAFSGGARREDFEASERYAREAAAAAERIGDTATLARALARTASIRSLRGGGLDVDLFERAVALEQSIGVLDLDYGPAATYANVLYSVGLLDQARELLDKQCARARERGDAGANLPIMRLAMVEFSAGNWDRAEELAREAYDLAVQSGREAAEPRGLFALAYVEAGRGNVEAARRAAEQALVLTETRGWKSGGPRGALTLLELSLENYERAYEMALPAIERYRRLGAHIVELELEAVEALANGGRVSECRDLLAAGEAEAEATALPWIRMFVARARGFVAVAEGDLESGEAAFTESVGAGREAGGPLELGRSLLALGSVQRRQRQKRAARESLEEALRIFEDLGARVWATRARREIDRIGGRRATAPSALSATEAEIAELVGAGRSNHEVAATLHLSPKTVEWNLSKIYRKLGVRSRTEMAAKLPGRQ